MSETTNIERHDIKLLSFDVDNTLIDLTTQYGTFTKTWEKFRPDNGIMLTYNTGRMVDDMLDMIERRILPEPDYIIAGVGTRIYDYSIRHFVKEFDVVLDVGWDLDRIEAMVLKTVAGDFFQLPGDTHD